MAMRMNDMGLMQNGFKNVARYKTFQREVRSWMVWTYDCWKNEQTGECVIRVTNNRRFHWLHYFTNRNDANDYIRRQISEFVKNHKGDGNWKREF